MTIANEDYPDDDDDDPYPPYRPALLRPSNLPDAMPES